MRALVRTLSFALLVAGCREADEGEPEDDELAPVDVQALLWCVLSAGEGVTADGEEVVVRTTGSNRGACLCLPVGTQPFTGSELDALLHEMALDQCEEDLRALGAVTTNCEELVSERLVDYESLCEPDDWPPHPRSASRARLVLALLLGAAACSGRELGDDSRDEGSAEHPAELLERHEHACVEWCTLFEDCGRDELVCECEGRDFTDEHVLCVEKATLRLECNAALTCEEIDLRRTGPVQDRRCYGESIAEALACFQD